MSETLASPEQISLKEVVIDYAILYHGSVAAGVQEFRVADEATIGSGLYLLDNPAQARAYATRRSRSLASAEPRLYGLEIEHARMIDLDDQTTLDSVLKGFESPLVKLAQQPDMPWYAAQKIDNTLATIRGGVKPGQLRDVAFGWGTLFTNYLQGQGYDGLIASEGGEGQDIGPHRSYVLFSPSNARVVGEQPLSSPRV